MLRLRATTCLARRDNGGRLRKLNIIVKKKGPLWKIIGKKIIFFVTKLYLAYHFDRSECCVKISFRLVESGESYRVYKTLIFWSTKMSRNDGRTDERTYRRNLYGRNVPLSQHSSLARQKWKIPNSRKIFFWSFFEGPSG